MKSERRSQRRVATHLPVRVRDASRSSEISAHTRDVSENGIFLYTKSAMTEGSEIELVLILPPELTAGTKSWVCCQARVLRVEPTYANEFGVAAQIVRIEKLPEIAG
jgi:hypothetical protein